VPDLVFKVSGKELRIPGRDYVVDLDADNDKCNLGRRDSNKELNVSAINYSPGFHGFDWLLGRVKGGLV
jgi:hypothetical protein